MILMALGWYWVVSGILFLIRPFWLKKKLYKLSQPGMRNVLFAASLLFGFLFIKAGWGIPGVMGKLIMFWGFLALTIGVLILKFRSGQRMLDRFAALPVKKMRILAISKIVFGALLLSI